ncbi:SHOCT domain-containing protein [Halorubellus sp. JP-L1]|uniref:SHOCT domain-containing protein n=1 Tax=Halorubellus sp. JP-L1 TaxID=2715753 RepID=UPI0014073181|nr:SHOCT domain-containing protein [Halorubellus sp. JP-L1]NHN42617.1 SHOCT domain-containing protein [Halorubellus sp. JP-L1]
MSLLSDRRLRWLAVAFAVVVLAGVSVAAIGAVAVASTLAGVLVGDVGILTLFGVAAPVALASVGFAALAVALLSWAVVRSVRVAEPPRSDRLAARAALAERFVPGLSDVGLSDALSPTPADRREALKERYARGDLDEREFEREMAALLADEVGAFDGFDGVDDFDTVEARLEALQSEYEDPPAPSEASATTEASAATRATATTEASSTVDESAVGDAAGNRQPVAADRDRP